MVRNLAEQIAARGAVRALYAVCRDLAERYQEATTLARTDVRYRPLRRDLHRALRALKHLQRAGVNMLQPHLAELDSNQWQVSYAEAFFRLELLVRNKSIDWDALGIGDVVVPWLTPEGFHPGVTLAELDKLIGAEAAGFASRDTSARVLAIRKHCPTRTTVLLDEVLAKLTQSDLLSTGSANN